MRDHAGRLAASLVPLVGDFAAAEDLVQDAIEAALTHWPVEGIPDRPDAWLYTVARRRGLDHLRRAHRHRQKLALVPRPPEPRPDDRLRLIFSCCHPALPRTAQVALTLRVVCGLTTAQIATAFLVPESTVGQRITRAKRKISDAGIPYRVPSADDLGDRLAEVLAVIYLLFNEGYLSTGGDHAQARDLADDAEFLAALLHQLMPTEPEVAGLLALIRLHRARASARFDRNDDIVQLPHQDRSLWNHEAIADAGRLLARAAARKRPGPYQVQAAIVACHAEAARWEDTDWAQIAVLYDMLLHLAPSPVTRLHRAIALRYVTGPAAALAEVDRLAGDLDGYHLFHATRAELLRDVGETARARSADERALALTTNPAQRSLLRQRLSWA
ncbi:sigma-70 family RNA polymerase sigma factor [Micromonospora costi]|uniref:RNA polymerase sigma factor n=1 Tax=Micromonospora costi TaxID=1530042 RepID=UPI0034019772